MCLASMQSLMPEGSDVTSTTLALQTLGGFDFEGHSLTQFVRHCAEQFLASEHKDIRMEAVRTCSRLLTPSLNVSVLSEDKGSIVLPGVKIYFYPQIPNTGRNLLAHV